MSIGLTRTRTPTRVLIAGGGVAAIEAALALKQDAGDLVRIAMLAPGPTFIYRPELVAFSYPAARRYPLARITGEIGVELHPDSLKWVDVRGRVAHAAGGEAIGYDALLLAVGAKATPPLRHALTLVPDRLDEQMQGVLQDLEGGWVKRIAFVVPERSYWPLPIYELALMAARRADQTNVQSMITLVTPEDAPLAVFGTDASQAVRALLDSREIETITSSHCTTPAPGRLAIHQVGREMVGRELGTDLVVTLPELYGPEIAGIPRGAEHGFVRTDREGRVVGADRVFAAGDLTTFPIKQAGIAAQQADSAAASIAALAGAEVEPQRLVPVLCGLLWDRERPLYLRARVTGSHGSKSEVSAEPLWSPPGKIQARYLGPYLESLDLAAASAVRGQAEAVEAGQPA